MIGMIDVPVAPSRVIVIAKIVFVMVRASWIIGIGTDRVQGRKTNLTARRAGASHNSFGCLRDIERLCLLALPCVAGGHTPGIITGTVRYHSEL